MLAGLDNLPAPRRIFCIGRNYADHAREMGGAPPSEPVIFMKPATSLITEGMPLNLPRGRGSVHHETELVLALGREGADLGPESALALVAGVSVGLDLTLRDEQNRLKKDGNPWELAKAFDGSAVVGRFVAAPFKFDPQALGLRCTVSGELRQQGNTRDMVFSIGELLSFLSRRWRLLAGDLVYTGTPAGVGPLIPGDQVEVEAEHVGRFVWQCL